MSGVEICVADSYAYPYSKSEAVNDAARMATRDIFIILDTDMILK